jgi:hypothetical protein
MDWSFAVQLLVFPVLYTPQGIPYGIVHGMGGFHGF